jgi:hypothetical protein
VEKCWQGPDLPVPWAHRGEEKIGCRTSAAVWEARTLPTAEAAVSSSIGWFG